MKKILAIVAVLALSLALLTACSRTAVVLAGTEWNGSIYGVETVLSFTETDYTLMSGETVLGSGPYTLSGSKLTWNDTAVTVSIQAVNGTDTLTITNADGTPMSYTRR